ncbi:MAG TPA: carboxypeptidase regulatory-like domain-containing protein [Candidatus Methylomirabilis sp.]|nr:carboxypeptidase regulatory-like domain-containing protein [Candidatus Methylomirabilis sp.]
MGKTREVAAVVMVAGLLVGVAARAQAYDAVEVKDGGTISGTVKFAGAPPARKALEVTKDKEVCGKEKHQSLDLIVGSDKGIENAVIRLVDISKGKKWASTQATLDQKGCIYKPHVVVVPAGGDLKILNSDGILHNIHTYSKLNASINKAQPKFKKELTEKFTKPEVIKVTCDAHAWMSGWIVVSDHPYVAVTDEKGTFSLKDVPAGTYKVEIWHETLGKSEKTVTLKPKEETKLNVELAKK